MFNRKFSSLFLICFVFLSQSLFSQIVLQGTVTDNGAEYLGNGSEPVAGVLVTITDQSNTNHTFSSYTDKQGQYSIEIIQTSIDDETSVTPGTFRLLQNYPNPFNPSTQIKYDVKEACQVLLVLYNINGQVVNVLVNSYQQKGVYIVDLELQDIPSGIYLYKIQMGSFQDYKKIVKMESDFGIKVGVRFCFLQD